MEEETYESDNDSEFWYESDLQLAAELGKTLLEKNRELESQLTHSQQTNQEQALEIEFLTKQLDILRDVNESRLRVYEEIERDSQDLERENKRTLIESKLDKQTIQRLTETVEALESKCSELQDTVDENMRREKIQKTYDKRRTLSVPSLTDACDLESYIGDYYNINFNKNTIPVNKYEVEIRKLQQGNKNMHSLLCNEQKKRDRAEYDLDIALQENHDLSNKVANLESKLFDIELERKFYSSSGKICTNCEGKVNSVASENVKDVLTNLDLIIEHDEHEDIKNGEVIKMKNGGSAYGSRESLNKVGIEEDPKKDTNVIHHNDVCCGESGTPSLLGELDAQYSTLIAKYEALVEAKSKRKANKTMQVDAGTSRSSSHKEVQTSVLCHKEIGAVHPHVHRSWGHRGRDTRSSHNQPPEYKKLFREIFDTLKKSAIYEDETSREQK